MVFYVIFFVYLKTDEILIYIVFLGDSIKIFPSEISANIQFRGGSNRNGYYC